MAKDESEGLQPRSLVAIVGRPNVGKSTLFNRLVGERRAIVEPTAGVTRDRLVLPVRLESPDLSFDLMDTGGIGVVDRADLSESVEMQVMAGLQDAELILFLVDAREGLTLLDEQVADWLRRSDTPLLLLANKCEGQGPERNLGEFGRMGFGNAEPISAQEGRGLLRLYERMAEHLPPAELVEPPHEESLRIAVVGRRNTGKSSFVNALLGEQRVIVSDIPGTTRDAVDIKCAWQDRSVTLVDTAGMHRRGKVANAVEYFSLTRSDQAIRRADLTFLFLDLTEPPARLDQELARTIFDRHKPVIVVGTKSDLVLDMKMHDFRELVDYKFPHLRGAPLRMISNLTGKGLKLVMNLAFEMESEANQQIGTGELNRVVEKIFDNLRVRSSKGRPRAYYATQLRSSPPTFLLFVNRKDLFEKSTLRAISKEIRSKLGFPRVPVRIVLRERSRSASKNQ